MCSSYWIVAGWKQLIESANNSFYSYKRTFANSGKQDIWRKRYSYDCFMIISFSNHGWFSHAWNTTTYYRYYFDHLLSLLLKVVGELYEYNSDRTAISLSFYASYKQLSSCCVLPHPLIDRASQSDTTSIYTYLPTYLPIIYLYM